jgi:hypothetical protein
MYVERLLSSADSASSLAFLRMLKVAHQSTSALIGEVNSIDLFKTASALTSISNLSTSASTPIINHIPVGLAAVTHMLDQSLEDLFIPYTEGTRYMDREVKNLNELYAGCLLKFLNWHVRLLGKTLYRIDALRRRSKTKAKLRPQKLFSIEWSLSSPMQPSKPI